MEKKLIIKIKNFSKICLIMILGIFIMSNTMVAYASEITSGLEQELLDNIMGTESEAEDVAIEVADGLSLTINDGEVGLSSSIKILITLTAIALAPIMLIMLTSFTRIVIVLHFTRTALGTQTAPPNQVLLALALFLTLFIMGPILTEINEEAIIPFDNGDISQELALERGMAPLREFMFLQAEETDLKLFADIANLPDEQRTADTLPFSVLVPGFIIGELRIAFIIGFLIYIPFIVIDMVVASTLMSMGMMMLPPTTISMPFKILLFVLADGWNLIIGSLVKTFYT